MSRLFAIVGLLLSTSATGQFLVEGIVYDNEGRPLPGANVVNRTDGIAVTDENGRFELNCPYFHQELAISFVGFKTKYIISDTTKAMEVTLEADVAILGTEPFLCVFYDRHTKIGLASGSYHTPIGVKIENFTPNILRVWPLLTTGIEWRTNNSDNSYSNMFFRKYEIARMKNKYLSLFGQFKSLTVGTSVIKEYNISPDITFKRFRLSIGYTFQKARDIEGTEQGHGVYSNVYAYLFGQVGIDLKTKYALNRYQYDYRLFWDLSKPKLSIGLGYEKIGRLNELSASLQYRVSY